MRVFFLVIFFALGSLVFGQSEGFTTDSLQSISFDELFDRINSSNTKIEQLNYSRYYLHKAKEKKDTTNIVAGFEILAALSLPIDALSQMDSIINITKNNPDNFNPANAYLSKGDAYYELLDYKNSLNNYLLSQQYASEYSNKYIKYRTSHGIGLLKNRIGDYNSALAIHKENLNYFKENLTDFNASEYLNTIFSTSISMIRLKKLDSSSFYNKLGLDISRKYNKAKKQHNFTLAEGVVMHYKGKSNAALDSIRKTIPHLIKFGDKPNLIIAYYYSAKANSVLGNDELAIDFLNKVDSVVLETNLINIEARSTYTDLHKHYKDNGEIEKQLYFLTRLISIDSTLNSNLSALKDGISTKFDIPNLIAEKEELINQIERKNSKSKLYFISLIVILLAISGIMYIKQIRLRSKFNSIISENTYKKTVEQKNSSNLKDVPEDIIFSVLKKLKEFEEKENYIDSTITLSTLAKRFQTNSSYLSKIINHEKRKNFSSYLNELRVDFAIRKLKSTEKFRKFTISAIANESGFKSSETFSKVFKSKTGLYPSYFIRQLEKLAQ